MRKGLKSTLLTVAVALLGLNAMAMAPVIGSIPDVVIGDAEAGTATNLFVFPNAFDSRTVVSDDTTSAGAIKWTFSTASASHYMINAHPSTFGVVVDTVNPSATYDLTQGVDDSTSTDSDLRTFTFRNIQYSPVGGPNTDPGNPGVTADSQTLTLVASDGSTASLGKSFKAMILNDGFDKLSGGANNGINVLNTDFTDGSTHGWSSWNFTANGGTVNLTNSTAGLCADASASGANFAGWQSEPASTNDTTVAFVDNAVYRIRTTVSTTAVGGHTPLWFLYFENSVDWYGGYFQFFDNGTTSAGAEAPTSGGTVFTEWLNPPAETTAGFKAVLADPSASAFKNFRLEVGVLDIGYAGNDAYDAGNDSGAVCWRDITLDRFDITSVIVTSTPYNRDGDFTQAPVGTAGTADATVTDVTVASSGTGNGSSTVAFAGTAPNRTITIAPTSATSWQTNAEFFTVLPGDSQTNATNNAGADLADNFPIAWTTGQLYQITYSLQAPSALAESNPPSYFYMGGYTATIEIISYVFTTNALKLTGSSPSAMPKLAAPQKYITFFHGNTQTLAGGVFKNFRPILFGGSVSAFQSPVVSGGVTITGNRVDLVHF